jgi:ferredoxin
MQDMKIGVDRAKCAGHAQCYALDPDFFPIDDEGFSVLRDHDLEPGEDSLARQGVAACPESALFIV